MPVADGQICKGKRIPHGAMRGLSASVRVKISFLVGGRGHCGRHSPFLYPRPGAPAWLTARSHEDDSQNDPLQTLLQAEERERVRAAVDRLDDRRVMLLRTMAVSPIVGRGGVNGAELGRELGISRQRVHQLLEQAIERIGEWYMEDESKG